MENTLSNKLNIIVAKDNDISINQTSIRLNLIEGYDNLEDRQQRYLNEYAKDPDNQTLACMALGYKTSEVDKWFSQETFSKVADRIYNIYTEALKSIDSKDAVGNSKIRARVIKAREQGGKYTEDKKGSNHVHIHGDSLADFMKALNS